MEYFQLNFLNSFKASIVNFYDRLSEEELKSFKEQDLKKFFNILFVFLFFIQI